MCVTHICVSVYVGVVRACVCVYQWDLLNAYDVIA